MGASRNERDKEKVPWGYKAGVGGFAWGGCWLEGDCSSGPPNMPRLILNGRLRGGAIEPRGGQDAINTTAIHSGSASIVGGYWFGQEHTRRAFLLGQGLCYGGPATQQIRLLDCSISSYNYVQSLAYTSVIGNYFSIATYGTDLYLGIGINLYKFQGINSDSVKDAIGTSPNTSPTGLFLPVTDGSQFNGYSSISWMQEFDGYLFLGLYDAVSSAKIVCYDGTTFTDDLTGLGAGVVPLGMGLWQDKLVVGFNGTPNNIRVRNVGAPAGTYATVAPAAGTVHFYKRGVDYKGTLYFPDGSDAWLWSYDGTTLQHAHQITGTATAGSVYVYNNKLYYLNIHASGQAALGLFDGTTWVDAHSSDADYYGRCLCEQGDDLLIATVKTSNSYVYMFRSPGKDTRGTYDKTLVLNAGYLAEVHHMIPG